jgi:hypothetical protein
VGERALPQQQRQQVACGMASDCVRSNGSWAYLSLSYCYEVIVYILYIYIYIYICAARGQPCVGAARVWWWYESLSRSLSVRCVCVWVVCVHTISTRMHIVDWGRAETDTDHEVMYNTRAAHTCSPVKCTHTHIYIYDIYTHQR